MAPGWIAGALSVLVMTSVAHADDPITEVIAIVADPPPPVTPLPAITIAGGVPLHAARRTTVASADTMRIDPSTGLMVPTFFANEHSASTRRRNSASFESSSGLLVPRFSGTATHTPVVSHSTLVIDPVTGLMVPAGFGPARPHRRGL